MTWRGKAIVISGQQDSNGVLATLHLTPNRNKEGELLAL